MNDLQETAALARMNLSEQEQGELFCAFEQMLSLFDLMQAADAALPAFAKQADFVTAMAIPVDSGYLRSDTAETPLDPVESMLSQAPERDGSFIVIPNVL